MRTTRTSPQIGQINKTSYPKCNVKKQHQKQTLNLVCLTKTCKYYGPICSLCKKDHAGHQVVPIKNILSIIAQAHKNLSYSPEERLQQSFHEIMAMLKHQVIELSELIKRTEDKLIEQYQQTKLLIQKQSSKADVIQKCLTSLQGNRSEDVWEFRKNICQLIKYLNYQKNVFQIKFKQQEIVKSYINGAQVVKENLFYIQNHLREMYSTIHEESMGQRISKFVENIGSKTPILNTVKPENMCFSPCLKAPNIVLQKDGKIAQLKENSGNKLVFFHNVVGQKIYETTVRILSLSMTGIIGIGVGLKDKLKQKGYKFQKSSLGHGTYMITSNTLKLINNQKPQVTTGSSFVFGVGDQVIITLKVKQRKLMFSVKGDNKKTSCLSLKSLTDASFKQLEFCAAFTTVGDKIQIL